MSTRSTPRSTRHGTPENGDAHSQAGGSPTIMTPGAKIKALLARFDSDDDSSNEQNDTSKTRKKTPITISTTHTKDDSRLARKGSIVDADNEDEEEDLPIAPRGRLAARMQNGGQETRDSETRTTQKQGSPFGMDQDRSGSDSEDNVRTAGRRNRSVQSASPSSCRSASPLFVPMDSPVRGAQEDTHESADESDANNGPNESAKARLHALVAQKRKEREEKERLEAERKAERMQRSSDLGIEFASGEDDSENDSGRKLTQKSRAPRKASKKALDEMNRETQRISRNMQLTHQATTKKKITLDSFFARFNASETGNSAATSSQPTSDVEVREPHSTPPTSPPRMPNHDSATKPGSGTSLDAENTLPPIEDDYESDLELHIPVPTGDAPGEQAPKESEAPKELGAPKESEAPKESGAPKELETSETVKLHRRPVRVNLSRHAVAQTQHDSDDDLEVVTSPSKARRLAMFENIPLRNSAQSRSLHALRSLAQLSSSSRNNRGQGTMTQGEMEASLLRRAREQAAEEREEKVRRLREKGIIIQTAEERARMDNEVEDLMEKARDEADGIARKEKAAAKKNGEVDGNLWDDDSEDGDYHGDQDDMEIDSEREDSEPGEEDAEPNDGEASDDEKEQTGARGGESDLIADQAEEAEEVYESEPDETVDDRLGHGQPDDGVSRRRGRARLVVSDDEEDATESILTPVISTPKPQFPNLGKQHSQIMGLSQAFAATLADSQDDTQQDSLDRLRQMPGMDLPVSEILEPDSQDIVRDSQNQQESGPLDLLADYTQTGVGLTESPARVLTQYSQTPEPTQDAGFVMSPFDQGKRFLEPPHSTIDTVSLHPEDTPLAKKGMRRLRRGQQGGYASDGDDDTSTSHTAFDIMRNAVKKPQISFDKKKSKAKDVIDEAAEESDDGYAGLGGASDEDSELEGEYDRAMINDNSGEVVDKKALAAFNANLERERDERDVNKLMKDITTGALRRKRGGGGDFDLSESDDERTESRRRAKRREFAKMRKALLADEKLNKMADDPKKAAFLRSIEDRDGADMPDFLIHEYEGDSFVDTSASPDNNDNNGKGTTEAAVNNKKRPLDLTSADALNRVPAKFRRKSATKKPASLAEIRESVSFLLNGPNADLSAPSPLDEALAEPQDDEEDELSRSATTVQLGTEERNDDSGRGDRSGADSHSVERTDPADQFSNPRRQRGKVVDRLTLRRQASSNVISAATASKLAFHTSADSFGSGPSFHGAPPLLSRRSTAATSTSSTSGSGGADVTGASGAGGSRKSASVNYYATARDKTREIELRSKTDGRREKRGLEMLKENGDRLRGLLGTGKSSQWE